MTSEQDNDKFNEEILEAWKKHLKKMSYEDWDKFTLGDEHIWRQNKARQQGAEAERTRIIGLIEHFFVIQAKSKFNYTEIHEFLEKLKSEAK